MPELSSINTEQGLYVLKHGSGYTCLGFEYADKQARAVAEWCGIGGPLFEPGTEEHYYETVGIMKEGAAKYLATKERCPASLSPQLVGLEGKRVEVVDHWGTRRRFIVGKSTGWLPCHLEIARRDSTGGAATYGDPFRSVTVLYHARG